MATTKMARDIKVLKTGAVGKSVPSPNILVFHTTPAPKGVKASVGQRGKVAEKLVQKHLEHLNGKHVRFCFVRLPDARAAMGRLSAQMSDFLVWHEGLSIPLEVKETAHDFRLSKAALPQLAVLNKVAAAGAAPYVLIYHSTSKRWRIASIGFFEHGVASWDLRCKALYLTAGEALASTGYLPA